MIRPYLYIKDQKEKILHFAKVNEFVNVLMHYGSLKEELNDLLSDMDYFFVTNDIKLLQRSFARLNPSYQMDYENRSVLYFIYNEKIIPDVRKIDCSISINPVDILKYMKIGQVLGDTILIDKIGLTDDIKTLSRDLNVDEAIKYHVHRFIEAFENSSIANQSADQYRFLFHQSIALQHLYTLEYMIGGNFEHNYLPKYFTNVLSEESTDILLNNFDPNSTLRKGYLTRKELLKKFTFVLSRVSSFYPGIIDREYILKILNLIYRRDKIWNIRDISDIDTTILRSNIMIRTSTLSKYDVEHYKELIENGLINSILDLRHSEEIERYPYNDLSIPYFNVPIGSKHVKPHELKYTTIGKDPFFYEYFPRHYHEEIAEIMRIIISAPKPIALHCHAGKDRTGIIVAIIQKLCDLGDDEIVRDYITSRSDCNAAKIRITLKLIEEFGGIVNYLTTISLITEEISVLKSIFKK